MYDEDREEQEPEEVETCTVAPGPCVVCGRPGQRHACFRCGNPVCYHPTNYFEDSTCAGWILDSWHPGHPHDNEMWCHICQQAAQVTDFGGELETAAGLTFKYKEIDGGGKVLTIKVNGKVRELTEEETRTLVAYLWTEKAPDLFGKQYDPDAVASDTEPDLVAVGDDLGELPDHPF